jgi:hypothetical protein
MSLKINKELFLSFLKTIQPDSDTFVFQTFTDRKGASKEFRANKLRDPLACTFTATAEAGLERVQVLQDKGAGVFIQMNYGVGRGGKAITGLAAYFLDTDGAPLEPIIQAMPKPMMVTTSSEGKYHIYWRTRDPMEKFKETQKQLAIAFDCDEAMVNLDRVVRVPGTWHLKDPTNPMLVKVNVLDTTEYSAEQLLARIPKQEGDACDANSMIVAGSGFELPEQLPAGDRTRHLIAYAGQLAAQGYGVDTIKVQIKKAMLERLPAGHEPIPDETLEVEIYPAVELSLIHI